MISYNKYLEYRKTLSEITGETRFNPQLNPYCISKADYISKMRYYKNMKRPNRVRNVQYTLECKRRRKMKKIS
jgi:hypothetical protein